MKSENYTMLDILKNIFKKREQKNPYNHQEKEVIKVLTTLLNDKESKILNNDSVFSRAAVLNKDESIVMVADRSNFLLRTIDGSVIFDIRMSNKLSDEIFRMINKERHKRFSNLLQNIESRITNNLENLNLKLQECSEIHTNQIKRDVLK